MRYLILPEVPDVSLIFEPNAAFIYLIGKIYYLLQNELLLVKLDAALIAKICGEKSFSRVKRGLLR